MVQSEEKYCPTLDLNSGHKMPAIGLGTFLNKTNVTEMVRAALVDYNYTHIDCAKVYENEEDVGKGLKEAFDAGIKREDIFITSKLWHDDKGKVEEAVDACLKRLGLEYLDLYLIHWMQPDMEVTDNEIKVKSPPLHVYWKAMEECVKKGKIRSLGVSNCTVPILLDLFAGAEIKPSVNQVEAHPYFAQSNVLKWHQKLGVVITAYATVGSGHYEGAAHVHKDVSLLSEPVIAEIAAKNGKSSAQVCINWAVQRKTIALVKTTKAERLGENHNAFRFTLDEEDLKKIEALD